MYTNTQIYLTEQFYQWEQRGRGWFLSRDVVSLEPPFLPFFGHITPAEVTGNPINASPYSIEPVPYADPGGLEEFQVHFPRDAQFSFELIEQVVVMLSNLSDIGGFEIVGTANEIVIQFVVRHTDVTRLQSTLATYLPMIQVSHSRLSLFDTLSMEREIAVIDMGLQEEFMRPMRVWTKYDPDPLAGIIASFEHLGADDCGIFQVLFEGAVNNWAQSMLCAVTDSHGDSFFIDAPEMVPLTKEKLSYPLFGVVIRAVGVSSDSDRAMAIATDTANRVALVSRSSGNGLVALPNDGYDAIEHQMDVIFRTSHRLGMLLNSAELASFLHIPDQSLVNPKLRFGHRKTHPPPQSAHGNDCMLGINDHLGIQTGVTINNAQRLRHMHVIGATGTGKSNLLVNLIQEDIRLGNGFAVLDPHGDLVDAAVSLIPPERRSDVIILDPSDIDYPVGLNIFSTHSELERNLLSSDLIALFQRFATSWGDQMTSLLANTINTILYHPDGGTLIDLKRILTEEKYRTEFLKDITDPAILYYWAHEYPLLRKNAASPILTRLDTFLRTPTVRNMVAQNSGINFASIFDEQKILLVKLSQGLIGEENSYLLGSIIQAKIHQAAQARQRLSKEDRAPFFCYIDEFQHFVTPSMVSILSGMRKYGLGLILAHQDLVQIQAQDSELANSVISNPAIRVCFRCGELDARKLEHGFEHFDSSDLQNLSVGEAIARVERRSDDFDITFPLHEHVPASTFQENWQEIISTTRQAYASSRSQVEEKIHHIYGMASMPHSDDIDETTKKRTSKKHRPTTRTSERSLHEQSQEFLVQEAERTEIKEHQYLQTLFKKLGESRGFRSVIEESVLDGKGRVDVGLTRENTRIACEISVSTAAAHEVDNIKKCLEANFNHVIVTAPNKTHLNNISEKAQSKLDATELQNVAFIAPDNFAHHLDAQFPLSEQSTKKVKGYRVKVTYSTDSQHNSEKKTKTIAKTLLDMSAKKKGKRHDL